MSFGWLFLRISIQFLSGSTFSDISSDALFNFNKDEHVFAWLKNFQIFQYSDWYNSVLHVLIENYRTIVKNKVLQFSDRNVRNIKILFGSKKNKRYRVSWIPSVLTVFSIRTFTREIKVVQSYVYKYSFKKHASFLSLCIGDNRGTVLDYNIYVLLIITLV